MLTQAIYTTAWKKGPLSFEGLGRDAPADCRLSAHQQSPAQTTKCSHARTMLYVVETATSTRPARRSKSCASTTGHSAAVTRSSTSARFEMFAGASAASLAPRQHTFAHRNEGAHQVTLCRWPEYQTVPACG